jgi:hypothetical protein
MSDDPKKDAANNDVTEPDANASAPAKSRKSEIPWLFERGAWSGDKRMERLGLDTENLTGLELWTELKRIRAELEAKKKRQPK